MIFFLSEKPEENCQLYDDLTLGYALEHAISLWVAWAHAKGVNVNQLLMGKCAVTDVPCVWMTHSLGAYDWMFKYTVHCLNEYYFRTSVETPMYLTLLRTLKENKDILTEGLSDDGIKWWPLSDPRVKTSIVAFHRPSNKQAQWSVVEFFPLVKKVHELNYQALSDSIPNMRWSKRSQPHWLDRF